MGEGNGKKKKEVREGGRQTIRDLKTENKLRVDGEWEGGKVGEGHRGGHLLG